MKINVTKSFLPSYEEYCNEIKSIWDTHWLTNNGEKHNKLESRLSKYLGVDNVVLFTNGHLALEAAIAAYNFPKGSEIITSPFTFVSTTNAIVRNNCVPIFCDIKKDDYTIDPDKIECLISDKTVAILPIHVYGNVCDIAKIDKIAKKHNLKVIYDAAHAFGVKLNGLGIGNFGDVSMFSFHATKVFNTIEGGCLCFKDSSMKQLFNSIKNFGIQDEESCTFIGGNAKMNEFQACMGLCNLKHIDECIEKRKILFDTYLKRLSGVNGIVICEYDNLIRPNYSYFPVLFDKYKRSRNEIKEMLASFGIGTRKYFYPITSEFDCYKAYEKGYTPIAKQVSEHILTLPLYPDLSIEDVNFICDLILK